MVELASASFTLSVAQTNALPFHCSLSVPEQVGEFTLNAVPTRLSPFPAVYVVSVSVSVSVSISVSQAQADPLLSHFRISLSAHDVISPTVNGSPLVPAPALSSPPSLVTFRSSFPIMPSCLSCQITVVSHKSINSGFVEVRVSVDVCCTCECRASPL